ncbi:MAG: Trk system potassium transporter TrkA [Anderseniella sp.]|jgi:trk system potassium uptake protein TrkA|nr:Trk system potassium transporter TrkA [Anderseniella sp.]
MKIIICGAGQVGRGIAERLAVENHDVTVIDISSELVEAISANTDVRGIVGHGAHPDVLNEAGGAEADMIIAVTFVDEVNMMACEVAKALFNIPTRVARVRDQSYLMPQYAKLFTRENTAVDVVISPEVAVGDMVLRRLALPGAFEAIYFVDEKVLTLGIKIEEDCPVINTPLSQLSGLFPDLNAVVCGIVRDGKLFVPHSAEQMLPGDRAYVISERSQASRVLALFGHEERPARRVLIGGGGTIGTYVARKLEERDPHIKVTIIENNLARAEQVADELDNAVVLHGSALDASLLQEAEIARTETYIALTNDDKVNVLSAMLAKQHGAGTASCLVTSLDARPLVSPLGIDSYIDPRSVTVSSILQHVRRGRIRGVHGVEAGEGEVVEAEALETSPMIGKPLREAELPDGIRIGAIVRDDEVLIPTGDTEIRPNDRVVMFALRDKIEEIQHLFRVSIEYF